MKNYLIWLQFLLFTSCATITRGVHEKLRVESDPPDANVQLSTGERGVTPAVFVKNRRTDAFTVTVNKPGYGSESVKVESKFSGAGGTAMAGNAVLGGLIGIGVDAASGAYNSLYPNPVSVHLVPSGKSRGVTRKEPSSRRRSPSIPTPSSSPQASPTPKASPTP